MVPTVLLAAVLGQAPLAPFGVQVVDDSTGRGVPMVELVTVHKQRYITDSAGWAAIDDPELMGHKVFLNVSSHGYEFAKDGFGYRGTTVQVEPGGRATLTIKRLNRAERLYRITGAGIYADSVTLGEPVPIDQPLLNAGVLGQDTVQPAIYRGKLYWFWGDTDRLDYPLGNFDTTGAVSDLPGQGGLPPEVGINLRYFANDKGFVKQICPQPGPGPVWVGSMIALPDATGQERLLCTWTKVDGQMKGVARGIAMWNDATEVFENVKTVALDAPIWPSGHPIVRDGHCYFGDPFPTLRCSPTVEGMLDLDNYEGFAPGDGGYAWRRGVAGMTDHGEAELIKQGKLPAEQARFAVTDADSGQVVSLHAGTVRYNAYRHKWIVLAVQDFGKSSFLGEVWYGEADDPTGPWGRLHKVVTHDRYSFYNPRHDDFFDQENGRLIYFEGTYATTFSREGDATPRYDYNQMLYRLDLSTMPH